VDLLLVVLLLLVTLLVVDLEVPELVGILNKGQSNLLSSYQCGVNLHPCYVESGMRKLFDSDPE
jgi:hypothetical protein